MSQAYVPPPRVGAPQQPPGLARTIAMSSIGGVAALIFVGAYMAGKLASRDGTARARVTVASTADPAAEAGTEAGAEARSLGPQPVAESPGPIVVSRRDRPAAADPEPASAGTDPAGAASPDLASSDVAPRDLEPDAPFADFDMALLHPDVAAAVELARAERESAQAVAERARAAAARARSGDQGTGVITYASGDVYEGELVDGVRDGVGVYNWANVQEDAYAGAFVNDAVDGLGVKRWADGATYYGERRAEAREGYGVFLYADGGGYEGAWRSGAPDGHGVVWNADGTVRAQGLWAGNTLVEAWIVPKPVATDVEGDDDSAGEGEALSGTAPAGVASVDDASPPAEL